MKVLGTALNAKTEAHDALKSINIERSDITDARALAVLYRAIVLPGTLTNEENDLLEQELGLRTVIK